MPSLVGFLFIHLFKAKKEEDAIMTWTPMISFLVLIVIFAIGNEISLRTKSVISLVLVSAVIYLVGYWTGLIPTDSVASTGLATLYSGYVLTLMVINLGTMMNLNQLLEEWKTVITCLIALVGLAVVCFTVGAWLFGEEYALVASAPIAGGGVATAIIAEVCDANGRPELGGFAALISVLQFIIGMPIAAYMLKTQMNIMQKKGRFTSEEALHAGTRSPFQLKRKEWVNAPSWWTRPYPMLVRLILVAVVATWISELTGIPSAVCWLVIGILACQFGFLEKTTLQAGGFYSFMMVVQLSNNPRLLSSVSFADFQEMLIPVIGMLLIGGVALGVFGFLAGLVVKLPWRVSVCVALCAMIGYPGTMLIAEDAVDTLDATDEEKLVARGFALPKMLVGGFTTVSIASIAFAGFVAPLIF